MEYSDKVVVVTGAGSGIGRATAVMFANEGAKVVACDINQSGLEKTANIIKANSYGEITTEIFDVRDITAVIEAVDRVVEKYGRLDILVNSAGIIHLGKIEDITEDQWDKVLDINLKGTFLFSKTVIPIMKSQNKGCIINITAAAAKTGGMNVGGNYAASKGGISTLTIHLAKQLAPFGIRVNAVSPGPIETPMLFGDSAGGGYTREMKENLKNATPLGMGTPEDIAQGILFLASDVRARYITGEILDIDGG
ncbi:MAG: SDR family NAD(P)-dependent oxidoreductase, partial [Candidatus Methanoperedens sp.]|nr:SDR family NAD(P)-dependent oxidoreductase [Candidatus Methanoperedens sp.]